MADKTELTGYPALNITIKTGQEPFKQHGRTLPITLLDFWRWSSSNLAGNTLRGQIAEFIVTQALSLTNPIRIEWDTFDLLMTSGLRIEVKSAAYLQSWAQNKPSTIQFSIRPTTAWNNKTYQYETESKRQADIYIFCLLAHLDKATLDPLDIDQWEFYMLPSSILNQACPTQKKISLQRIKSLGAHQVSYEALSKAVTDHEFNKSVEPI